MSTDTCIPPSGIDRYRGLVRKVAEHLDPKNDALTRHEVLHYLGPIPALERIEDLIAAGRTTAARHELAAFIRPEGYPRLNLHRTVEPARKAAAE